MDEKNKLSVSSAGAFNGVVYQSFLSISCLCQIISKLQREMWGGASLLAPTYHITSNEPNAAAAASQVFSAQHASHADAVAPAVPRDARLNSPAYLMPACLTSLPPLPS